MKSNEPMVIAAIARVEARLEDLKDEISEQEQTLGELIEMRDEHFVLVNGEWVAK